jgi:UrcA family protein
MPTMRKWISSLTVAAAMSLAAIASAAAADAPTRTVHAADLDLAKPSDVETLYGRVRAAATEVCQAEMDRNYRNTRVHTPMRWRQRCVQDAVEATVREVGNPALAALHTQAPRIAADF